MEHRPLPRSALAVSPLCLGTMTFGTPVGEREAIAIVHAALDLGVRLSGGLGELGSVAAWYLFFCETLRRIIVL